MNPKRSADGVPKFSWAQFVVFREYLDALPQPKTLNAQSQSERQVVNVDSAVAGERRFLHENPKMAPASAHFERRMHLVPLEEVLQFEKVLHRSRIVGVDGNPLRSLCGRVNRIQADREFTFEMPANGSRRQNQFLPGSLCL